MHAEKVLSIYKFTDWDNQWEFVIADGKAIRNTGARDRDYVKFVENPESAMSRALARQEANKLAAEQEQVQWSE